VACQDPPDDDCAEPVPEDTDGTDEELLDVDPLDVELPLDDVPVESSPEDELDVPDVLDEPDELVEPEVLVEPEDVDDPEVPD
jgi:hypothetical protein